MPSTPEFDSRKDTRPLVLPGLLIIAVSLGGYCALQWTHNRREISNLRQDLRSTQLELKDARFQIEAKELIIRRQMEMIRKAEQQNAPASIP